MISSIDVITKYDNMISRQNHVVRSLEGDIRALCRSNKRSKQYVNTAGTNMLDQMRIALDHIYKLVKMLNDKVTASEDPDERHGLLSLVMQTQGYTVPNVLKIIHECNNLIIHHRIDLVEEEEIM